MSLKSQHPNLYKAKLPRTFTWHDDLVAGHALGGELIAVAVIAEQGVLLAGERLICQRAIAAETAEAVLVVMPVLVEELLAAEQKFTILFKVSFTFIFMFTVLIFQKSRGGK